MKKIELSLNKFRDKSKYLLIILFLVVIFLLTHLIIYHLALILYPFQTEFREGVSLINTQALLEGLNPYDLKYQPQYTNFYGIFYNLLVYPLAKVFGSTLLLHRIVSAFCILASSAFLFTILRWLKTPLLLALIGAGILYAHLLFYVTPLARPDALGFLLFFCSILIPWRYSYSRGSLVISLGLSIAGWLTKPYFVLGIPYLAVYLFVFKSKKKGLKYGFVSLASVIAVLVIVNMIFETYLNNTLFGYFNVGAKDINYAIKQLKVYSKSNFALFLSSLIPLGSLLLLSWKKIQQSQQIEGIKLKLKKLFNITEMNQPLIQLDVDFVTFSLIISFLLFWFSLGRNAGNWLVYIYQLISPFLIIVIFRMINNQRNQVISMILLGLVTLNLFNVSLAYPETGSNRQPLYPKSNPPLTPPRRGIQNPKWDAPNDSLKGWQRIETLTSKYNNIFSSPAIVSILMKQGKPVYDSGNSQYFADGAIAKRKSILKYFFQPDQQVEKQNDKFLQDIKESIAAHKFDLIVVTKKNPLISQDWLKKYYDYQETVNLKMPFSTQPWDFFPLNIWKPKNLN